MATTELSSIIKQWGEDSEINDMRLGEESLKTLKLHSKYYNMLLMEKGHLYILQTELESLEFVLDQYYNRLLTMEELKKHDLEPLGDKKILKPDVKKHIENMPKVVKKKKDIYLQNMKIDFLQSILIMIKNRNFVIRDAIEWRKFEAGA